jgi:inner membrane protein
MSDFSGLQSVVQSRIRSSGVKLFVVCGLALLMMIPAFLVEGLVEDRTKRSQDVIREISAHAGGQQTFLGPTLAIPYQQTKSAGAVFVRRGMYLVFPTRAVANLKVSTEERRRSLFKVPVFQVEVKLDATFDLSGVGAAAPEGAELDWSRPEMLVGVTDARGALADATLTAAGKTSALVPAEIAQNISLGGEQGSQLRLTLFGSKVDGVQKPGGLFSASSNLRFSGAQRIAVLAYGKTTQLTIQGDWPNPGFDGGFLPVNRTISQNGFTASWSVPFIARGVRAEGQSESITGLDATALGVSFIEVADPYQSVNRSLKYAPLFLGLVFLSYFIFEVNSKKRVHPSQYVLIGLAQIIFYLLLLSIAERIGFDYGFLFASAATVILLAANAEWIFSNRLQGLRALLIFSSLYVLIYVLLRLEDNALLVGAIASFVAIAAAMYFTRGIDWYGSTPGTSLGKQNVATMAPGD